MAWYDEAVFYHIYPLGMCGAPKHNDYNQVEHRLNDLLPWIDHLTKLGVTGLYIGPLFESVGHGYETTDYRRLDSRLGDNADLKKFVAACHKAGIRVILDGVFNHTGRDFFAFRDILEKREASAYRDWYCNVNFSGNNEYNDGFSYDNWGGYNLLVKLNQRNLQVKDYICDVVRFWVSEFDIDGIRLDAADVLDFDFMKALRGVANEVKDEFWLMGEVIHGDYSRWVNEGTLHSVTNYQLHKGLYSGLNDHNFFEIAHTVKRLYDMGGGHTNQFKLYNFVDNHDVERIYTKLNNKGHFGLVNILQYTLPGIPSIYYGSEFGIEGKKERFSDDSLRPCLRYDDYKDAFETNECVRIIASLGRARKLSRALSYGDYTQLTLTNRQYAYVRRDGDDHAIITLNCDDNSADFYLPVEGDKSYIGLLSGQRCSGEGGNIHVTLQANTGEIWVTDNGQDFEKLLAKEKPKKASKEVTRDVETKVDTDAEAKVTRDAGAKMDTDVETKPATDAVSKDVSRLGQGTDSSIEEDLLSLSLPDVPYEDMTVMQLQAAVAQKMAGNGPVTDQMLKTITDNIWHDSLVNWVKSFR